MNYIYGYENLINKKWYIGQTTLPVKERHRLHMSSSFNEKASDYNCLFHKKIREYGAESFKLIILEEVEQKQDLDSRECFWIEEKQSFIRNDGYNMTIGGQKRKNNENYCDVRSAFDSEQIVEVINLIKNKNLSLTQIAKKFKVSLSLICSINTGKKYQQLNETYPLREKVHTVIDEQLVKEIILLLKENRANKEIADMFSIDDDVVYRINSGKAHKQNNENYPIRRIDNKTIRANRIKELLIENTLNNKKIADLFGCDPSVISNINYGKNYRDEKLIYPIRGNNKS